MWIRDRLPTKKDANEKNEVLIAYYDYEHDQWYEVSEEYWNHIRKDQWWYPLNKIGFPPEPPIDV